jgi:hypothetical protein
VSTVSSTACPLTRSGEFPSHSFHYSSSRKLTLTAFLFFFSLHSAWEASFKDHLKGQTELLAEVGKGNMTPELDAKLKKTVQECVLSLPVPVLSAFKADSRFLTQARLLLRLGLSGALALDDIEGEGGVVFLFCSEEERS